MKKVSEKGQSILESMIVILFLCVIFCGLLQLFELFIADLSTQYAAFVAGRAKCVGFSDRFADRGGRCAAIPASGKLITPAYHFGVGTINASETISLANSYIRGNTNLRFERWYRSAKSKTRLRFDSHASGKLITSKAEFINFPLQLPLKTFNFNKDNFNIRNEAYFKNYKPLYLESF